jgi:hypothetical protein
MSTPRRGPAALAATGLAVVLGACGGETRIDAGKVERMARSTLRPRPESVACPSGFRPSSGAVFTCRLRYRDGDTGALTVHEVDSSGRVVASNQDLAVTTIGGDHAQHVLRQLMARNHVGLRTLSCPASTPTNAGTVDCRVIDKHGLRAVVTEHIDPGGALAINPATDLHVKAGPRRS